MANDPQECDGGTHSHGTGPLVGDAIMAMAAIQASNPLVYCIVGALEAPSMVDTLQTLSAVPIWGDSPSEAASLVSICDSALLSIGASAFEQRIAARDAARLAHGSGKPWVLRPEAAGAVPMRSAMASELYRYMPTAVNGLQNEIDRLSGAPHLRAVDAIGRSNPVRSADLLSKRIGSVVVSSAENSEIVTDGSLGLSLDLGIINESFKYLPSMQSALIAAFLTTSERLNACSLRLVTAACTLHAAARCLSVGHVSPVRSATAYLDALVELRDPHVFASTLDAGLINHKSIVRD